MATTEKAATKTPTRRKGGTSQPTPFEAMDALFDAYFNRNWAQSMRMPWPTLSADMQPFGGKTPKVDVIDQNSNILVRAELPGVDRKDLEVSTTHNSVSIKGTSAHEKQRRSEDYYHCEITHGGYSRTVKLPTEVQDDKARATFKDGVLELILPKMEQPTRRTVKID